MSGDSPCDRHAERQQACNEGGYDGNEGGYDGSVTCRAKIKLTVLQRAPSEHFSGLSR